MNKNVLVLALIVVMLAIAGGLVYGIVAHKNAPEAQVGAVEPVKAPASAAGETEPDCFASAADCEKKGDLLKAKEIYQKIVEKYPGSSNILKEQEALDNLNVKILFSSIVTPDSVVYEVQKGDTLTKIAKKFDTTTELIAKANNMKDANVKLGKKLKISKAKFSIVVDKSQNILTLKSDQDIFKTYRVSTGKNS